MKTTQPREPERTSRRAWLMPLLIAVCAVGAGVTGTLLWVGSRSPTTTDAAQSRYIPIAPTTSTQSSNAPAANIPSVDETAASAPFSSNSSATQEPPATLTLGMTSAQATLTLGNWYYDHKRWLKAIMQYQKALAGGLDNADIRTDLGNCYRFAEQPQKALEQYRLAQKQNPQHEQSLLNQGGLYAFSFKQPDKAIAIWRKYLQQFPNGQTVAEARQLIAQMQSQ